MAVYVDNARLPFGRMIMCHMIADSTDELLQMADAIGVAREWIQYPGTPKEHFDISLSKKRMAIECGAQEVDRRALAQIMIARMRGGHGG